MTQSRKRLKIEKQRSVLIAKHDVSCEETKQLKTKWHPNLKIIFQIHFQTGCLLRLHHFVQESLDFANVEENPFNPDIIEVMNEKRNSCCNQGKIL